MTKKKQWLALLTAVAVLFVMLFSTAYIIGNSNHDCCGNNCPICYHIEACRDLLKTLSLAVGVTVTASVLAYMLCRAVAFCVHKVPCSTPVSLKVKILS